MMAVTFARFVDHVVNIYSGAAYSPHTRDKIFRAIELLDELGIATTADLTTETMARYVTRRLASGEVCATTVRGELSYVSAIVEIAIDEGWLDQAPRWRRVRPRKSPRQRKVLHSIHDVRRVFELLRSRTDWEGQRLYTLIAVVAYTGVRRDEALRIQIRDVHLDRRLIEISGRRRLKTEASAAPVPIAEELVEVLGQWLERVPGPWLFPGVRWRGPWTGGTASSRANGQIKAIGQELGIAGLTFQSLRHTFATWSRRRWGLSAIQLRDVLRHTTEHTQEHYVHDELDCTELIASVSQVSYA